MSSERRIQRVESDIKKAISLILRSKINDPRIALSTINEVEVSKDLSYAKVYYTCFNNQDVAYISKAFKRLKGFFRSSVSKILTLRVVPDLKFIYDESFNYGVRIEEKIQIALDKDSKFIN